MKDDKKTVEVKLEFWTKGLGQGFCWNKGYATVVKNETLGAKAAIVHFNEPGELLGAVYAALGRSGVALVSPPKTSKKK